MDDAASDAAPAEGSPYRALEVAETARSIASAAKPDAILASTPIVFAVAMGAALLVQAFVAALVAGACAALYGLLRFIDARVSAPLLEADRGGLRLRCSAIAHHAEPPLSSGARIDLVIPWAELQAVVAEPRGFDDGIIPSVVFTTPARTITVRADIFAERSEQIVVRIRASQADLARAR